MACPPPWTWSCSNTARSPHRRAPVGLFSGVRPVSYRLPARLRQGGCASRSNEITTPKPKVLAMHWRELILPSCSHRWSQPLSRNGMDAQLSLALSQAYNNWIHEVSEYSPNRLKFAADAPLHDVNLACQELVRCFVSWVSWLRLFAQPAKRPLMASSYWDPMYSLHEELDVAWCSTRGQAPAASDDQLTEVLVHPPRRQPSDRTQTGPYPVDHLGVVPVHRALGGRTWEAETHRLLGRQRIQWDYASYRNSHAPYRSGTPIVLSAQLLGWGSGQ